MAWNVVARAGRTALYTTIAAIFGPIWYYGLSSPIAPFAAELLSAPGEQHVRISILSAASVLASTLLLPLFCRPNMIIAKAMSLAVGVEILATSGLILYSWRSHIAPFNAVPYPPVFNEIIAALLYTSIAAVLSGYVVLPLALCEAWLLDKVASGWRRQRGLGRGFAVEMRRLRSENGTVTNE